MGHFLRQGVEMNQTVRQHKTLHLVSGTYIKEIKKKRYEESAIIAGYSAIGFILTAILAVLTLMI